MSVMEMRLIDVAKEIGPTLRQAGEEAEQQRRLPRKSLNALIGTGLHRMLLPKSLGGLEVDPVTCAQVIEEIAQFDTAAAWALQNNSGAWWSARLPDAGVEEIYGSNADTFMATAFYPLRNVFVVDGGYRLTGLAPLASIIHDSEWLLLTGMVMDGSGPKMVNGAPEIIGMVLRTSEAQIIDTWHTLGMRG